MSKLKNFNDFINEKNTDDKSVEIFAKQRKKFIDTNKEYNTDTFSKSDKMKDPNYKFTNSNEIGIGTKEPILAFKRLNDKYWRKAKQQKKKYLPQGE